MIPARCPNASTGRGQANSSAIRGCFAARTMSWTGRAAVVESWSPSTGGLPGTGIRGVGVRRQEPSLRLRRVRVRGRVARGPSPRCRDDAAPFRRDPRAGGPRRSPTGCSGFPSARRACGVSVTQSQLAHSGDPGVLLRFALAIGPSDFNRALFDTTGRTADRLGVRLLPLGFGRPALGSPARWSPPLTSPTRAPTTVRQAGA